MTKLTLRMKRFQPATAGGLALGMLLLAVTACNRVTPEKADAKGGTTGDKTAAVLANKSDAAQSDANQNGLVLPGGSNSGISGQTASTPVSTANNASSPGANPNLGSVPGIQIENGPGPAGAPAEEPPVGSLAERLGDRSFVKLELPKAALEPDQLLAFLAETDRAVRDLIVARDTKMVSEKEFLEQAKRLSTMKMDASERLYYDKTATTAQQKTAIAAQVESLSQLTGLGDVEAAQKLLKLANELTKSNDSQLAHQGRLVLLGFRLNQLVEGQNKDPQVILDDVTAILSQAEYRGLVELLALQQALGVLKQLGYSEQAAQVEQKIVKEFRNSADPELATRAWQIEVASAPELQATNEAIQKTLSGEETDPTKVASAATQFIAKFPSLNTVAYFLKVIVDLEYTGHATAARELSKVIADSKAKLPSSPLTADIDNVVDGHNRRLGLLGKQLSLSELTGMDGKPFEWSQYRNKVVLVYYWASWEVPSLNLIDQVKQLRQRLKSPDLEIVGICTDDGQTINNAEQLVQRQSLNWRNVRSSNPQALGLKSAAAKEAGVNAYYHFALLVDKQGKVRAIHPSFDKLDAMINDMLAE